MSDAAEKYDRLAGEYDHRWSTYISRSLDETISRLTLRPGMRVLDVACGTGKLLERLRDAPVELPATGIDISVRMIRRGAARIGPAGRFVQGTAGRLPFRERTFDLVLSTSSFHYFQQPEEVLRQMRSVLSAGGAVVITDWCSDYLVCRIFDSLLRVFGSSHGRALRLEELRSLLENNGFSVDSIERYRFGFVWGMMTAHATLVTNVRNS